ncbi:acetate--CoA ligase [Marinibactrum halimedae]|uniref:Acetate--CoA ligase n=1 Tax=Marinibactrum halimedae TaxID=1444977 RepID=A0AA37WLU2_9GAMM|nr:acetate--CoA ligase [Marinibactrum halimedae]MCD9460156.1 acetate--CoA ligase [Marinibactrum halimedae]GLS26374.1 acetyl-coenzyme A synthetase [Marinibactrum halimedae]
MENSFVKGGEKNNNHQPPLSDAQSLSSSHSHEHQASIKYLNKYQNSIENKEAFWQEQASQLQWSKPFTQVSDVSFDKNDLHIRWFADGELNVCVNCVDRHLAERADQPAIVWEGDNPDHSISLTYKQLHEEICKLANALESLGVTAGDRVILYMPMVPEAAFAMLACARIGAIHSAVFGGFSSAALADRINNCEAKLIITADLGLRGTKSIPLKASVDEALTLAEGHSVDKVLVVKQPHGSGTPAWNDKVDLWYHDCVDNQSTEHTPPTFDAEHPLFILYTSGSTGKPKGLQHSSGGYLCYAQTTFKEVFDYRDGEVFWCTADIGWITGHTYLIYGPLAAGATTIMYEGVPNFPTLARFGEVIDKHNVNIFYTAPTTIRMLMADANTALSGSQRTSLRILGTVGEPISPDVWQWYYDDFGLQQAQVVDTWWQTETGGHLIVPIPDSGPVKPGAAQRPFYGIEPQLVDSNGDILEGETSGHLVILDSWPGQARTIWGDHQRFIDTYFSTYEGMYFSGDGARRDEDGDYWITGRVDDVLNVSGHRLGTAEIESAALTYSDIAEAAVVGYPHDVKGQGIYIFVVAKTGVESAETLTDSVRSKIRQALGPIATPDHIQWSPDLPKTRSGKIMRRILRKIASNDFAELGDTSTLADPSVVDKLISGRKDLN